MISCINHERRGSYDDNGNPIIKYYATVDCLNRETKQRTMTEYGPFSTEGEAIAFIKENKPKHPEWEVIWYSLGV